jgi:hypothetical protein
MMEIDMIGMKDIILSKFIPICNRCQCRIPPQNIDVWNDYATDCIVIAAKCHTYIDSMILTRNALMSSKPYAIAELRFFNNEPYPKNYGSYIKKPPAKRLPLANLGGKRRIDLND